MSDPDARAPRPEPIDRSRAVLKFRTILAFSVVLGSAVAMLVIGSVLIATRG